MCNFTISWVGFQFSGESGLSQLSDVEDDGEKKRPANAPLMRVKRGEIGRLSPDALARRCSSKGRGSLYDPTYGICCHFCRLASWFLCINI